MSNRRSFQFIDPDRVRGPFIDDISKKMKKGSLQDAYKDFKKNTANYQPYSVLMFPGITDLKQNNIDYDKYFKKLTKRKEGQPDIPPHFDVERLKKVVDGIYMIEEVAVTEEYNNAKLEEFRTAKPSTDVPNKDEWNCCVDMINNLFENNQVKCAYMRDILDAPEETGNMLENYKSHISTTENPEMKNMPGINSSMHYMGERGSFTPLHVEDGGLSSINLLKAGGPKVWFIVPYKFQAELEASFADHLKINEQSKAKHSKRNKEAFCKDSLQHKLYLITPQLLTEWNVPYSIIVQRPGDLFFIRTGTYHAVINVEKNIAEAINFGCDQWTSSYQPVPCNCLRNLRTEVQQDRRIIISYKQCKKKLYKCEFGCEELFVTKAKLIKHEKIIHKTLFTCAECSRAFNEKKSLIRHIGVHSVDKAKKECQVCKKKVIDLNQHMKRIHENLKECEKCKKKFYSHRLEQHRKTCTVVCPICRVTYTNKGYLTQHMKYKHPSQ